ncbi:hypothetical protein CCUS01_15454 [Colletotrichum cuscutae]|uniref:Uncharacterized protein n=1 Tax=Colletotrichum cuscutae TaxID=1209917 RepID=A0AAI9Y5S0_9PEZI|nr:hypothetical protein CCUS01_15454 [Colletotrichum cuscutae]
MMSSPAYQFDPESKQIKVDLQLLKHETGKQLQQRLYHLVEAHENDRKDILARFLTKAALTYPGNFQKLRHEIEHEFECYVASIRYGQGNSSSLSFTSKPSPPPWNPDIDFARLFSSVEPDASNEEAASSKEAILSYNDSTPSADSSREASDFSSTGLFPPSSSRRVRGQQKQNRRAEEGGPSVRRRISAPRSRTIKTSVATRYCHRNPSMAFSYDLGGGSEYYILHCPNVSSGCKFALSSHPFTTGLAPQHFMECGISFQDDTDIVRRFALRRKHSPEHAFIFTGPVLKVNDLMDADALSRTTTIS